MYFIILFLLNRICSIQINPEYSYIFLKVRGTGNINILYSGSCTHQQPSPRLPNEVYINEAKKNDISYSYSFTQSPNNITLIWYKPLNATGCMFFHCRNIIEMDLSLFKTSEITCFAGMFNGCSSLTSLNLSNFDTSQATSIFYMFNDCSSLISIDLSNFNTEKVTDGNSVFSGCSSLKYLNLKNAVLNSSFINQINSLSLKGIIISDKYISYFKNQYNKLISCIKFDEFNTSSKFNYYYISSEENEFICNNCGYEFYETYNDINNYKLDEITCYEKCEQNFIYDIKENKTYCTLTSICPSPYNKLILDKSECTDDCRKDKDFKYEFNNICYKTLPDASEYIHHINDSLIFSKEYFLDRLNLSDLSQGKDVEMRKDNILISFTTSNEKNNYLDDNKININLGKCEKILKDFYNISYNDSLYILSLEAKLNEIKVPKIEYEVYYPLFNTKNVRIIPYS